MQKCLDQFRVVKHMFCFSRMNRPFSSNCFFFFFFFACVCVSVILFHVRCFESIMRVLTLEYSFTSFFPSLFLFIYCAIFSLNFIFVYQKIILMWSWSEASFSIPNEFRTDKIDFNSFISSSLLRHRSRNKFCLHIYHSIGQQTLISCLKIAFTDNKNKSNDATAFLCVVFNTY